MQSSSSDFLYRGDAAVPGLDCLVSVFHSDPLDRKGNFGAETVASTIGTGDSDSRETVQQCGRNMLHHSWIARCDNH